MSAMKRKGDGYERELAAWFNTEIFGEERCQRAPLSGGGKIGMQAGGADILGTDYLFVEAKRVEKLNWREAVAQSERNAAHKKTDQTPIVITRKSREATGDSLCVLRLKDFKKYYEAYLHQQSKL